MAEDSIREPIERLSRRQLEVLELLAKGLTNEDLASVLGISPTTARTHVTAILARLEVGNRTAAAAVFRDWSAGPTHITALLRGPRPNGAEGHYLLGRHFQSSGEPALATRSLESAIQRNPSFAPAHALLAQMLQLSDRSDAALARMKHAAQLGPGRYVDHGRDRRPDPRRDDGADHGRPSTSRAANAPRRSSRSAGTATTSRTCTSSPAPTASP
jgi:DNA-binding CsgD family transcriptional regulator